MLNNLNWRKIANWLLQNLFFVVVPAVVFYYGFEHIGRLREESLLRGIEQSIDGDLREMEKHFYSEPFLVGYLKEAFQVSKNSPFPAEAFADFHAGLNGCFNYILWDGSGKIIASSGVPLDEKSDWKTGWKTLRTAFFPRPGDADFTNAEIQNIRRLMGPKLLFENVYYLKSPGNTSLLRTDLTDEHPRSWVYFSPELSVVVFIDQKELSNNPGLSYFLQQRFEENGRYNLGFVDKEKVLVTGKVKIDEDSLGILRRHSLSSGLKYSSGSALYYQKVLDEDLSLFAVVDMEKLSDDFRNSGLIAVMVVLLLLLPVVLISTGNLFREKGIRLSLSRKLTLLFVYSNGLPLAVLFFMGHDYINQKEFALYDEIHGQGIRFLQNFDERFESEHSSKIMEMQRAVSKFKNSVKGKEIDIENFRRLVANVKKERIGSSPRINLVASSSKIVGGTEVLMIDGKLFWVRDRAKNTGSLPRDRREEMRVTSSIGSYLLATLNGQPQDGRSSTEVEILAESIMQKSIIEVQNEFIAGSGRIVVWGMGVNIQYAYVDLVSLSSDDKYDYLVIVTWSLGDLEKSYLKRQFLNANRNLEHMQMCVYNSHYRVIFPENIARQTQFLRKVEGLSHKPNSPREFVEFNNQKHLLIGLRGKSLNDFCLAAVYPVSIVQKTIYQEKKRLVTAGIFSLLLAFILGQLLSHSILTPMQIVSEGAQAIRQRNFSHRLPRLGSDEFGEIADLFNEAMIDLEELKVAGTVQEHLFPKVAPDSGCFQLCGKTVATGDLGGDYYDYFLTTENNVGVLIGDVAGKGVGAALVMAMAKGAVTQLQGFFEDLPALMLRLNTLMLCAHRGQKQYMAFQCLNLDPQTGRIAYSNAGGWPPLVVNSSLQSVREVSLPGPLLGARKKPEFSRISIELAAGEALVLYTDGIIKGRNYADKLLDLDGLKKIVLSEYCQDPDEYCQRIISAYKTFTGLSRAQDDISVLVIIREV